MAETEHGFDLSSFGGELQGASAALAAFAAGPAKDAADDVSAAFERAGERIANALGRAATGGEASFRQLVKSILEELAKVALERVFAQGEPFFGARAAGGAVNAGGAYLVGERGPELFAPRQGGEIVSAASAGAVTVNLNFAAGTDAQSIVRHQGQIAASLARAVAYGRRNL